MTFHLLTVFPQDAAEQKRYYVNVHLKKPARVLFCHFVGQVEQINSYLGRLPGVIDSPKAISKTKKIKPFDEANLAQLIPKFFPIEWQNQYRLSQGIILQDMQSLMDTLEIIKKANLRKSLKQLFLERVRKPEKREEIHMTKKTQCLILG